MELVLLSAKVSYLCFDYNVIVGIFSDVMEQQRVMKEFSEIHKNCVVTYWSEEFKLNELNEIDIKDLIP